MEYILGGVLLAVWYLTEAIGGVLGFVVHHWIVSIVVAGIVVLVLHAAWSKQNYKGL